MSETKTQLIYAQLKKDILNLKYNLDDVINEQVVAEEYKTSKTPVREALAMLVQEGFLVKHPRRGYFIKEINLTEYYELLQYRFMVELGIINYIITNCEEESIRSLLQYTPPVVVTLESFKIENKRFHMAMAHLTQNRYMISALETIFELNVRQTAVEGFNKIKDDMHQDHRRIVEAMLERDIAKAKAIVIRELERSDDTTHCLK